MKQYLLKVWMTAALSLLVVGGVWGQESYTSGYPNVSDITHESATLNVSASVGGYFPIWPPTPKYYSCYVVLPSNQNPPTISQVLSGEDSNSVRVGINFQGKIGLMAPGFEFPGSISGLAADTEYVVYLVTTEDDFQTVVIETTEPTEPTAVPFTTEVAPEPLLMDTSSLSPENSSDEVPRAPTLEVSFNQAITWGPTGVLTIHRSDNDAPAATISREQTGATISQNQLSIVFSSESLEYGTEYYVIIDEGFVKALNTSAVFPGLTDKAVWTFTTETAPPFWEEGYPLIDQQDASKLDLNVLADQTGTVYAVITSNHLAPSAEQIALGKNAVGDNALVSVNRSVASINNPTVLTVNFGTSVPLGTVYFLHTVLKNNDDKYSDVESIAVDRIVPKINEDETYPEDGFSNTGVSEDIVIVFSEHVFGADGLELTSNSFSLNLVEGPSTSVPVDFSVSSTSERTTVTLNPADDLVPITDYTITIQSVYDASGNASGELTWSFQTDGEFTWTGRGDVTAWEDSNNWDGTYVSGKSVVISGDATAFPIVEEGDVSVHNLTIEPTAVLTQTGGTINVSGEFHLLSSAERNASYLPKGGVLNVEGADVDKVFVHQTIPPNDDWIFLM